jgi:hypothetical protein
MITVKKAAVASLIAAFLTVIVLVGSHTAFAGFTASLNNPTNTIGTGTSFLTASTNGTPQCSSVPSGNTIPAANSFSCAATVIPAATPATGTASISTLLSATGTTSFTSASYKALSCFPAKLDNAVTATNPLLVRGNSTFDQGGPAALTGSESISFNGTNTVSVDVTQGVGLTNFTLGVWFKTASASGAMFGWSNSNSTVAGNTYDRHMYMTSTGRVGFSTYSGAARNIASTAAYNDNNWHYAVVTGRSAVTSTTSNITLYIDGAQVATSTFANAAAAENTTGYWRVGQARSNENYPGAGQYFNGNLSNFTVIPTPLTAAQVSALNTAGTQTSYQNQVKTLGATHHWKLDDTGLVPYTGTLPGNAGNPCSHVRVTVGTTAGACVYPAGTTCPALSSTYTLTSLANAAEANLTPSTPATSQTLVTSVARDTTYNANYDVGLHLLIPVRITENGFTQTFTWSGNKTII